MSNIKKVQTEADRLLKKVNEGLDAYDELHEKLANAPNASAKERLEGDLKRELKKLQRHREAMKSFMQNDDYKEKTKMQVSRKKIEERMETFRAIEREMKTKAFSNEGLASAALERADSATEQWLKDAIEEGRKKIELLEYEVQKANNGRVRRGKQQQKSEYQIRLENLQTHFFKWESLLRMVNNEELDTDEVDDLQEPIQKVLEDDVDLEVMEDMSIYDSFDIPEPKAKPVVPFDVSDYEDKKVQSPKTTAKAKTPTSTVQAKPSPFITSPKETAASSTPVPSSTQQPALAQTPQQLLPPTASSPADDDIGEEEPVPEWMDDDMDTANDDTFGDDAMSGGFTIGSLAEMASATSRVTQDWEKSQKPIGSPEPKTVKAVTTSLIAPAAATSPSTPVGSVDTDPSQPFPPIPGAAPGSKFTPKKIHELLDMSLGNLPHTLDVQRQRPYEPPNAIDAIPYFPQEVLPVLSNKDVYHQMDLDTLFFIFYYHQKSYQQYFAAKELKARSYRYHTKQQRWYQRLERPQTTTETEERGSYTFFDFEDKWDHDRIDDFLFEYKYLENELH
ncbi:Not1 N-terminal domain, CCR4-Not complex component family protein [Leishmania donovani]|uniref:Not1 N-terminal domain, CCR4-Not complex component family protein n=1 Tax=Leishmania donovani TaxID=5661 RepID=A0A504XS56_LEIDO|nr:Not1 N-terminal domain, CCR4-Not complex component family protein [Leishmania donovani]